MPCALRCAHAALVAIALAPVARADTYTWNGSTNGNWSTAENWAGGSAPVSAATTTILLTGSTNTSMTQDLANPLTLNSLATDTTNVSRTLNQNASQFPLEFVANNGVGPTVTNNTASSSLSLFVPIQLTDTTTFISSSTSPSFSINLGGGNSPISGTGGLVYRGLNGGGMTIQSTSPYTGATTIEAGNLKLSGVNGKLTGTSSVTVGYGGTLTFDNAGTAVATRLGTAPIVLKGGTFAVTANSFTSNVAATAGSLSLPWGQSTVTVTTSSTRQTKVTLDSLSATGTGTVVFTNGGKLGTNAPAANVSNVFFTTAPTLTGAGGAAGSKNISILSNALVSGAAIGDALTLATYNSTNGIRALTAAEFTSTLAAAGSTDNVRITADAATDTATVNSLVLSGDGVDLTVNASQALTVTSGALVALPGATLGSTLTGSGTVNFGSGGTAVGYVAVQGGTFTVDTAISAAGLVKSGTGTLALSNTAALGAVPVAVNAGTLRALGSDPLKDAGTIRVEDAARLEVSGGTFRSSSGGTVAGNGTLAFVTATDGTFQVDAGSLAVSSKLEATSLTKTGAGTLSLGGAYTGTGATTVSDGTLLLTGSLNGSSTVAVNGGTFGGTGTAGAATVASGATVLGGTGSSAAGTLSLSALTLQSGSTLQAVAGTGGSSSVAVSGTLTVAAPFTVALGSDGSLAAGTEYTRTIATYGGLSGVAAGTTFTSANPGGFSVIGVGAGFGVSDWTMTFGASALSVYFTPTPEPGAVLGVAAAGFGLAGWVRRRRGAGTARPPHGA